MAFLCWFAVKKLLTHSLTHVFCTHWEWYTGWLKLKYPTAQNAISRQPCEIFIPKFLDIYGRDCATIQKFFLKLFFSESYGYKIYASFYAIFSILHRIIKSNLSFSLSRNTDYYHTYQNMFKVSTMKKLHFVRWANCKITSEEVCAIASKPVLNIWLLFIYW